MTIERVARGPGRALALAAVLLALGCGGHSLDPESLPANIRPAYAVFEQRCSKCHSLARPLDAAITDPAHWHQYVARMRRMPGSGINQEDAVRILQFLTHYTEESNASPESPE